jgi:uncharacterized protein YbjT (DUF2867 family)
MKIAIAGGTGLLGRMVVTAARRAGHEALVLSRSVGVDLTTGRGLAGALAGAEVVIDVANVTTLRSRTSVEFFEAETRQLLAVGAEAGVRHHIALSIVGVDRVEMGYYQGKVAQERLIAAGPLPWSVLRATQFHEFAGQLLQRGGPVVAVPRMVNQPIAAAEVADALVALASAEPGGLLPDLGGPQQERMVDMVRRLQSVRGGHRPVIGLPMPGALGRQLRTELLPVGDGPRGRQTFEQWLAGCAS